MSQVEVETVGDRVTIQEAARRLGIKDDAVRKRLQRGTLDHEKDLDGRVYVFLDKTQDTSQDRTHYPTEGLSQDSVKDLSKDKIINVLEDQIQYLKEIIETRDRELEVRAEELAEMRRIVAALTSRIPELPAASPQRSPQSGESNTTVNGDDQASELKTGSWWRRVFG